MKTLNDLRKEIDDIDLELIKLIALREEKSRQIGEIKKQAGTQIRDNAREEQLKQLHAQWSDEQGLSPDFIEALFKLIISHSRSVQN